MHKYMLKLFKILRNFIQFNQIMILFIILFINIYWIQETVHGSWKWMKYIAPILEKLVSIGAMFSSDSLEFFGAVLEYKFVIIIAVLFIGYFVCNWGLRGVVFLEEVYGDGRSFVKKMEEEHFNKSLEAKMNEEQRQIKNYKIYVETSIKKKFSHKELNISLDEQNKIMNKFLVEKTGIVPTKYENGFLYSFSSFATIDSTLTTFFKLIKSSAPLDYVICVQIFGANNRREEQQLKKLINLHFVNKISMVSDTAWRYRFNTLQKFNTSQLGLFQKDGDTFEVHEFQEIF